MINYYQLYSPVYQEILMENRNLQVSIILLCVSILIIQPSASEFSTEQIRGSYFTIQNDSQILKQVN